MLITSIYLFDIFITLGDKNIFLGTYIQNYLNKRYWYVNFFYLIGPLDHTNPYVATGYVVLVLGFYFYAVKF